MTRIRRLEIRRIVRPLKTAFSTALGSKAFINNLSVTVVLDDGARGTGEVPTSFSVPDETVHVMRGVLREVATDLVGSPADAYEEKIEGFRGRFPRARMTVSGLEVALFRAHLASQGKSEFEYWGGLNRSLESDITVPFSSETSSVRRWLRKAILSGFRVFKCKVSGNLSEDKRFISLVQSILKDGPDGFTLRLDGNQGFTRESLLECADMLEKTGGAIELFEQPLPKEDLKGLAYVRERVSMPIILDESVFSVESLRRALDSGACSGVNIKMAKSGISESRRMIEIARREGIRLMVGCMMETMTGLSAAVYLACGTTAFDFVDLDSIYFLRHRKRYADISLEAPYFRIE
jgi:L-Ala-D/L-Glu epimerase